MARLLLVAGLTGGAHAWVTKSQASFGATVDNIGRMMEGKPRAPGVHPIAELSLLWTYNPDGLPFKEGPTPQTEAQITAESLKGLGGGVTWAWDPRLCDQLMPMFSEKQFGLITCDGIRAAVRRAFAKWEASSRFIKMVDMTADCDKLGINHNNPPHPHLWQDPSLTNFHGGCPLAEIWVTAIDESSSTSSAARRLQSVDDVVEDGVTFSMNGVTNDGDESSSSGRGLQTVEDVTEGGVTFTMAGVSNDGGNALSGSTAVATALTYFRFTNNFRFTNGKRPFFESPGGGEPNYNRQVIEVYGGLLSINAGGSMCWYLDSDFCSQFHAIKKRIGTNTARQTLLVTCIVVTGTFVLIGLWRFWNILMALTGNPCSKDAEQEHLEKAHATALAKRKKRKSQNPESASTLEDVKDEIAYDCSIALAEASKTNPFVFTMILTGIMVPMIVFTMIIAPCWDCYDFEGAMLHEMGHLFGLGHPDNIPSNLRADAAQWGPNPDPVNVHQEILAYGGRVNKSNCMSLWNHTLPGVPALASLATEIGAAGYEVRNSVMEAFTQHNPRACLEDDDVEGINTLYPDCSLTSQSTNVCLHTYHRIGMVRVMFFVLLPMLSTLLVIIVLTSLCYNLKARQVETALEEVAHKEEENKNVKAQLGVARWKNAYKKSTTAEPAPQPAPESPSRGPKFGFKSFGQGKKKKKVPPAASYQSTSSPNEVANRA